MRESVVRGVGLTASLAYGALVLWLYATQPQTFAQVSGGLTAVIGAYAIDQQAFDDGLRFFRAGQFPEARAAFGRADRAQRDARTQFYIAYAYYREGFGHVYSDDALFKEGLAVVDRAIALAPGGRLVVDDADLQMHSADELRAELHRGLTVDASDFNPLRVLRKRK
jgi:tetratricopeptide (TPR) repeat protein